MNKIKSLLHRHAIFLLILMTGLSLRVYTALSDPFLHPWDERFHALVARNMMDHPFKPMLRAHPVTDNYDPNLWCCNHIWLHKPPLFMWQMALSMKLFGTSLLAMRLPSILMGSLMLLLLYRIGLLFYKKHRKVMACLAAALLCFSYFHLQLISGRKGMDHNDVALGFYVLASFWAFAEYSKTQKWYWIILIGLFAGLAILNKWLLGLLVFGGWGFSLLVNSEIKKKLPEFLKLGLTLAICGLVFLPWQAYILKNFREQALYEYAFNRRHITEALEGHTGDWTYYLNHLPQLFGEYIFILIGILGLLSLIKRKQFLNYIQVRIDKNLSFAFGVSIVFVFCFFSFVVKTKMDTYLFFIVPFAILFLIPGIQYMIDLVQRKWVKPLIYFLIFTLSLNPLQLIKNSSANNPERNRKLQNTAIYKNLSLPDSVQVVMNLPPFEDVELMFFQNSITAYSDILPEKDLKIMEEKGLKAVVFPPPPGQQLPDYIQEYGNIYVLRDSLAW